MKKIIILLASILMLSSCNMDFYRSDTMTSAMLKENPGAAVYTTDGVYTLFKDIILYNGSVYSGNSYVRHLLLMSELRGDNAAVSFATSDPLYQALTYSDNPTLYNLGYFWYISYKIIYAANSNIESIPEGATVDSDHMLGENYFFRAFSHLNLSNLYSRPYSRGRDNLGIVLRTSTDCSETKRATVGEVYDQIVLDLQKAAELMKNGSRRGNAGFVSYDTARGLLTRVYLYMGMNQECVDLANEMLGANPAANLEQGYQRIYDYFATARDSKETLWCVAKLATDDNYSASSQVGSMYYKPIIGYTTGGDPIDAPGWGEIFYSDPLLDLFLRWPDDLRYQAYCYKKGAANDGTKMIYWPVKASVSVEGSTDETVCYNPVAGKDVIYNAITKTYSFKYGTTTYQVKSKMIHKDKVWYVDNIETDSPKDSEGHVRVFVRENISGQNKNFPAWMMRKFADQDGDPQLCSPVMIRWAEVILNRAEANAKLTNDKAALDDVNILRTRAGLPAEAMYTTINYAGWGYQSVLDVVLEERNLELCFEGHRAIDLYRNGKPINRKFTGTHTWETITVDYMDANFPFCIPFGEVSVSGIPNNK